MNRNKNKMENNRWRREWWWSPNC